MLKAQFKGRRAPKQERARITVDAIVEAAALVLQEQGYAGATTNRIAEKAGVGVGTLYEYFADKESLTRAVLERCMRRKLTRLQEVVTEVASLAVEPAIRRLLEVFVQEVNRQYDLTRVLLGRAVYVSLEQEGDEIVGGFAELLRGFLVSRRAELRPIDVEMTTFLILHSLDAILDAAVLEHPDYLDNPAFLDELAALFGRFVQPG